MDPFANVDLDFTARVPVGSNYCFASDMQVRVQSNKNAVVVTKHMKDLRVGDRVLVNSKQSRYEPMYDVGHYDHNLESAYLELDPSGLKLPKDHMVFIHGKRAPVSASSVNVGDVLVLTEQQEEELEAVTSIRLMVQDGAYAPFTSSGTIVVNGVQVSTFISFQGSDTLVVGGVKTGLTYQWMARTFELPHKWLVGTIGRDDREGISSWVTGPLAFAKW